MIKKNVTEYTCDWCGARTTIAAATYNEYPAGWLAPDAYEKFHFSVGEEVHEVSFHGTIFCCQKCLCDYFQGGVAAALEPKEDAPSEEATA